MYLCGYTGPAVLGLICLFLVANSLPFFRAVPPARFLLGARWQPPEWGLGPLLADTLLVVGAALLLALPVGLGAAIFLAELAPPRPGALLEALLELVGAIPAVVLGLAGATLVAGAIARATGLPPRPSGLAAALCLAVALVPGLAVLAAGALRAIPHSLREAAAALGATPWETVARAVLPAAAPGLAAVALLALGRAAGETMIMLMAGGNVPAPGGGLLGTVKPITATIAGDMGDADDLHAAALFALGLVLFGLNLAVNLLAMRLVRRGQR